MSIQWNGNDLPAGWKVQSTRGLWDAPDQARAVASLPGAGDPMPASALYATAPRQCTITLLLAKVWSASDLDAAFRALAVMLRGQTVTITTDRRPNQQLVAWNTRFPSDPLTGPEFVAPFALSVAVGFLAAPPWWTDTPSSAQSIAFTSTPVATPTGTAACWPVVTITNTGGSSITNPHILQKNSAGTTIVDLPTTCTIPVGDAIQVDAALQRARRRTSGVWTTSMSMVSSGFSYPRISPLDGAYNTSSWPTIQTDKGSGGITYSRNWA